VEVSAQGQQTTPDVEAVWSAWRQVAP